MKMSVVYFSASGNTQKMAECIAAGANSVEGVEAKAFPIDAIDEAFGKESKCIILGCPTYAADTPADFHVWLEKGFRALEPAGKLGGAFSTAQFTHGGDELVIQTIMAHMLVSGMMVYASGGAKGRPVIHLGPVAIATAGNDEMLEPYKETFTIYGQRMAEQAVAIFGA
ncbi:MAG: flavodoxin family protein [Oscillospiraceae bacterium]|jgi:NAD(P)H dehydrogenase (quinone)|nr:flavodoxin family protein [Oscillospiraceae bacterium]